MQAEERVGLQDDRGTEEPPWAHEERTEARDDAIGEAKTGRPFPRTVEDQQLPLDEQRFRDHETGAAGTGQLGGGRQQTEKQDGQITYERS